MAYMRLTLAERYQIEALLGSGLSRRRIAKQLCRSISCISEEIRKNAVSGVYKARTSDRRVLERRRQIHRPYKICDELEREIRKHLNEQWSPEQISGRLRQQGKQISHETIYRYIYRRYRLLGDDCYKNLRRNRRRRYSRQVSKNFKNVGIRRNRKWIDERPAIVERRERAGDFERDTLLGKFRGPVLLTIVDRASRQVRIKKIERINADLTHKATCTLLRGKQVHSITNDNGPEFDGHRATALKIKTDIYFNHPYSSWQRGTNENTNGLIRQYFKKGTDFDQVSDWEIAKVEHLLNNRPRKTLGYQTPNEVERQLNQRGVSLSP